MSLEHNVAMRHAAQAVLELATEEYGYDARFWQQIRDYAIKYAPLPPAPPSTIEPLSDEDARRFGRKVLNFGVHRDKCYDEAPLDYLEWLADQNVQLVRYIRSRRVQGEMVTREDSTEDHDR